MVFAQRGIVSTDRQLAVNMTFRRDYLTFPLSGAISRRRKGVAALVRHLNNPIPMITGEPGNAYSCVWNFGRGGRIRCVFVSLPVNIR